MEREQDTGELGAVRGSCAVRTRPCGADAAGRPIHCVVLTGPAGLRAEILTLGAALRSLMVPDRDGQPGDIVLGHDSAEGYVRHRQYFGATVGRYANRIAAARFLLDGQQVTLDANEGDAMLHGGGDGFDRRVWTITGSGADPEASAWVTMRLVSPDGDGGFPGELTADVTYRLGADTLDIEHEAVTTAPTMCSITHHSYFNLGGAGDVLDHRMMIHADRFLVVDDTLIPTGERRAVAGSAFDFRRSRAIGEALAIPDEPQIAAANGHDHHFIVDGVPGAMRPFARVEHPASGRVMDLSATAPGVQFYAGNSLGDPVPGKGGQVHVRHGAFCLEPQEYPDSPNRPEFPSARLNPGETYRNWMRFRFSTASA